MRALVFFILHVTLSGCASIRVHNQTDMFIDIEANQKNVWMGCSDINSKAENSLMTFYLLEDGLTHEFMFRKVMDVNKCLKLEKEYKNLLEDINKVRLVGISPMKKQNKVITDRVPQKFKKPKTKTNWTFIRFSTPKGCESYFEGDCEPEKYWGGTSPPLEQ